IGVGKFQSAWSIRLDGLSAVMLVAVTSVSALVHLYSWGYMADDTSKPRFFAYLSLFTFAMLALVTAADFMQLFFGWEGVDLASVLLFIGAMGKSAQFFLHTWLPDAMEGPTPVSALIHAATMVTAGVYMVCLLSPMFEYAPFARNVVTLVGAVTALFAATV